jgi:hypothetical protein
MRIKQRVTVTLTKKQLRIIEKYGYRNKSKWIGDRIEEWYLNNVNELERLRNKLRWKQFVKIGIEDEMRVIAERKEKLEAEKLSQAKAIIHKPNKKKR